MKTIIRTYIKYLAKHYKYITIVIIIFYNIFT